ncbi:MAG TPA: hypothetical protein VM055_05560 [Novosphingobium sp.]|nr:hypothetical protein [Novosphingobium sp.]
MIVAPTALRRIGWVAVLAVCCMALFGLALKVNALRSEVRLTERKILALKRETLYLETEFETRANQQQLAQWNSVEFGYVAPGAGQYLENVRELAALGKPAGPGAPAPIRVAAAPSPPAALPTMVSPLTGKPLGEDEDEDTAPVDHDAAAAKLGERLGTVEHAPKPSENSADKDPAEKAEAKP